MRICDVDPAILCRSHLLGEHAEAHAVRAVIARRGRGYSAHPEVMRWRGKLAALKRRHDDVAAELARRGHRHLSPMPRSRGRSAQDVLLDSVVAQVARLRSKGCACRLS